MKREAVLVKDAEGQPLVRRVIDVTDEAVFVAADEAIDLIESGELYPVGFRRECVFAYDGKPLANPIHWEKMKRWEPH